MPETGSKPRRSFFSTLGRGFDLLRTVIGNVLLVVFILVLALVLFSGPTLPQVPDGGALVLKLEGIVVEEQSATSSLQDLFTMGQTDDEVPLQHIVDALDRAASDDRISLLLLDFDDLVGVSAAHMQTIGSHIEAFKASGKPVWAVGNYYGQSQYYLASFADAVYMHPMGQVLLTGFDSFQPFFSQLLDKIRVNIHVFRVGTYKAAVEPFTRSDMSDEARQANQAMVDGLWQGYLSAVAANRQLQPEQLQEYADGFDRILADTQGDMARAALERRLVDELLTHDQMIDRVAALVGQESDGGTDFRGIGLRGYLAATAPQSGAGNGRVAVIRAEGAILMGEQPPRSIGAETLTELIRRARKDDSVRALVLRVNSPGGSAFASEVIRQELELVQISGKPVVISMGSAAASGGYWISATADRIFASPGTITGSIGIFGILPSFEESLAEVGVRYDGVGTTALSGGMDPATGISPVVGRILQANVEAGYQRFINLVARGRDMTPEAVDAIAQGRVWLGTKALELGLVDELGELDAAVASAAELAGLETVETIDIRRQLSPREQLMRELGENLGITEWGPAGAGSVVPPVLTMLGRPFELLLRLNDPANTYALCEACRL